MRFDRLGSKYLDMSSEPASVLLAIASPPTVISVTGGGDLPYGERRAADATIVTKVIEVTARKSGKFRRQQWFTNSLAEPAEVR